MSQKEIDQTKLDAINSLPQQCKEIGKNFFDCLEYRAHDAQNLNIAEDKYDSYMSQTAVPRCLAEHNLEACLIKNQH